MEGSITSLKSILYQVVFLILIVLPFFLLTRLLKIEHTEFHDQWEKDGRPNGLPFWFPVNEPGAIGFRSSPWIVGYKWLFITPPWIKEHPLASRILLFYRVVSLLFCLSFLSFCLLAILSGS